jgi:hypothetical protein
MPKKNLLKMFRVEITIVMPAFVVAKNEASARKTVLENSYDITNDFINGLEHKQLRKGMVVQEITDRKKLKDNNFWCDDTVDGGLDDCESIGDVWKKLAAQS